jgi:CheY-specific phosphatase CheX
MFALKNAGPDDWKDKIETVHEVGDTLAGLIERSMAVKGRTIDVTPKSLSVIDNEALEPPKSDTSPNER